MPSSASLVLNLLSAGYERLEDNLRSGAMHSRGLIPTGTGTSASFVPIHLRSHKFPANASYQRSGDNRTLQVGLILRSYGTYQMYLARGIEAIAFSKLDTLMQGNTSCNARNLSFLVTRVASLEAETDVAANNILDVSGVTEPQQARTSPKYRLYTVLSTIKICL